MAQERAVIPTGSTACGRQSQGLRPPSGLPTRQKSTTRQRRSTKVAASLSSSNGGSEAAAADDALAAASLSLSAEAAQARAVAFESLEAEQVRAWQGMGWAQSSSSRTARAASSALPGLEVGAAPRSHRLSSSWSSLPVCMQTLLDHPISTPPAADPCHYWCAGRVARVRGSAAAGAARHACRRCCLAASPRQRRRQRRVS